MHAMPSPRGRQVGGPALACTFFTVTLGRDNGSGQSYNRTLTGR